MKTIIILSAIASLAFSILADDKAATNVSEIRAAQATSATYAALNP